MHTCNLPNPQVGSLYGFNMTITHKRMRPQHEKEIPISIAEICALLQSLGELELSVAKWWSVQNQGPYPYIHTFLRKWCRMGANCSGSIWQLHIKECVHTMWRSSLSALSRSVRFWKLLVSLTFRWSNDNPCKTKVPFHTYASCREMKSPWHIRP